MTPRETKMVLEVVTFIDRVLKEDSKNATTMIPGNFIAIHDRLLDILYDRNEIDLTPGPITPDEDKRGE